MEGGTSHRYLVTWCDVAHGNTRTDACIGYTSCVPSYEDIQLERGKVHYALLPVWMLSTEWGGKRYMFAVNGQTGKTVGDLPVNKGKVVKTFAAVAAAVAAIGCAIVALM